MAKGSTGGGGYIPFPFPSALNDFYQGIKGVYRPTDGNLYAPKQEHGPVQFDPIKQYDGATKNPLAFNAGTAYQRNQSIDNKVTGNYDPQTKGNTGVPYLQVPSFMDYLQ